MRRIGSTPAQRGCGQNNSCPDVIELETGGDFVVIGYRARREVRDLDEKLAAVGAGINQDHETAVVVPRDCILHAAKQLAAEGLAG
ncbi:hypothetical protein ABZ468_42950 [Streptomyces sp. NPDC005708]|uniref:hypothetical protein n=1 Tax=Streptomyces sp. NPDC005708 TaxID=3154564 RepID=UPI00340A8C6B